MASTSHRFHILIYSMRLGATALKAVDDSWWVNHISGYEHAVFRMKGKEKSDTNVDAMVEGSA